MRRGTRADGHRLGEVALDGNRVDTGSHTDSQGPAEQLEDRASLALTAPHFEAKEPKLERGWLHLELHERCGGRRT